MIVFGHDAVIDTQLDRISGRPTSIYHARKNEASLRTVNSLVGGIHTALDRARAELSGGL